jgi:hypothetical protein
MIDAIHKFSKEFEKYTLKLLLESTNNLIADKSLSNRLKDNITTLKKQISNELIEVNDNQNNNEVDPDNDDDNDRDNRFGFGARYRGQRMEVKFQGHGIVLTGNNFEISADTLQEKLLSTQKTIEKVNFHLEIIELCSKLSEAKLKWIDNNEEEKYNVIISKDDIKFKITKEKLNFVSKFFYNIETIKSNNQNSNKLNFDYLDCEKSVFSKIIKFLNQEKISIEINDFQPLLDMANYFMIDDLTSLIETELEGLISKNKINFF